MTTKILDNKVAKGYKSNRRIVQPIIGVSLLVIWLFVSLFAFKDQPIATKLMANSLIGLTIGYLLQRSFFGFAGSVFRTSKGSPKLAYAVLVLFGLGAILVAILVGSGMFLKPGNHAGILKVLHARPISLGTVIGAGLFGVGMVLAKACASGILTDMSTGAVTVIIGLVFFIIGSGPGQMVQNVMNGREGSSLGLANPKPLSEYVGSIVGAVVLTLLLLATVGIVVYVITKKIRERNNLNEEEVYASLGEVDDTFTQWRKANGFELDSNDENKLFSKLWLQKVYFNLFAKKFRLLVGAILLSGALFGVILINGKGWGVTTSFARWFDWIFQCNPFDHVTDAKNVQAAGIMADAGSWRNFGIIIGAVAYAFMANKFRFQNEFKGLSKLQVVIKIALPVVGGFLLGFGARMADGCNAGQLATGMATFSLSSWLFGLSMVIGGTGSVFLLKFIKRRYNVE